MLISEAGAEVGADVGAGPAEAEGAGASPGPVTALRPAFKEKRLLI